MDIDTPTALTHFTVYAVTTIKIHGLSPKYGVNTLFTIPKIRRKVSFRFMPVLLSLEELLIEPIIQFTGMETFKALIVEDDETFRLTFKKLLLSRFPQMDVAEAGEGEEALEKMKSFSPDIVFMDIKLPGENGLKVTKRIRVHYPDIPIIILTSYDLPEYRQAARASGANHFTSKHSTSAEEIFSLVESILES